MSNRFRVAKNKLFNRKRVRKDNKIDLQKTNNRNIT